MADSALLPLANATITFQVAGLGVITDPQTGNVSPQIATVAYIAFLKAVNVDPVIYPGINADGILYEGYLVKPVALDQRIDVGTTGTLNFGSTQELDCEVVRARLGYGDTGAIGAQLSSILGAKITLVAYNQ